MFGIRSWFCWYLSRSIGNRRYIHCTTICAANAHQRVTYTQLTRRPSLFFENDHVKVELSIQTPGSGLWSANCGYSMQKCGLANFISGADLYRMLASPFHVGRPLHLRVPIFALALDKQHRELGRTEAKHWNLFLEACLVV